MARARKTARFLALIKPKSRFEFRLARIGHPPCQICTLDNSCNPLATSTLPEAPPSFLSHECPQGTLATSSQYCVRIPADCLRHGLPASYRYC